MRQHHRVIDEEGLPGIFLPGDEISKVVRDNVRTEFSVLEVLALAVDFQPGIRITVRAAVQLP